MLLQIVIDNNQLLLHAESFDDRDGAVFKKTMNRTVDLPQQVDFKLMHCATSDGILTIEMPLHLQPHKHPSGPKYVRTCGAWTCVLGPSACVLAVRSNLGTRVLT